MADTSKKDTIYIDIDDEITTIIEKVRGSSEKIVALVLPKRATVLQSVVNMKLLKRTADDAKKSLVLITSEAGLMPLAGSVGLYVAKNLQTKPEVPAAPGAEEPEEIAEEPLDNSADDEGIDAKTAGNRPIGELAGAAAVAGSTKDEAIETLELDDDDDEETAAPAAGAAQTPKPKKNKKLKIPNFNRFRVLLALGILALIIIIVGWIFATKVLPRATVTLTTDTNDINSNLTLNLDTNAQALDPSSLTLPAQIKSVQKSQQQQVPTTGQKNNGTTATGSIDMSAGSCSANAPNDVPAGSGVSTNGLTYITQEDASFDPVVSKGHCTWQANGISMTAQAAGSKYNVNNVDFTVAGRSDVTGTGSANGGTDNIIQVVSQADIDNATSKIAAQDTSSVKQQLEQQLQQAGLFAITATFNAGTPTTTTSSNVGDQASTVTVTQVITYTMFGVNESDLKTVVDNDVKGQIDPSKQTILTEGLDSASFHVNNQNASSAQVAMSTTATAGPDLNKAAIQKQVAGQKSGQIIVMLRNNPGVVSVKVQFSPFWVTTAPSNPNKVNVVFQKAAK